VRRLVLAALALTTLLAAGCGGSGHQKGGTILIAVDAPFTRLPALAQTIDRGVQLAAAQANEKGGVLIDNRLYTVRTERLDNALSPQQAVSNVRQAIGDHAVAVVTDGTGVDASWSVANRAHLPVGVVYDGTRHLVDPAARPNVFRVAPTDHGVAFRLAEYLAPKHYEVALLYDDSGYGQGGYAELQKAFSYDPKAVAARIQLPSTAANLAPEVLRARRAGATALVVWAQAPAIANVLTAARASGWDVPVYAAPAGEDPLIRQQLARHPTWVDGLTVGLGRLTAEVGPGPFESFEKAYEARYGLERVGVHTRTGAAVYQIPDQAMYAYDFTNVLLAAAAAIKGKPSAAGVLAQLERVQTRGANGDQRSFNEKSHEGVVDDDIFFARFRDMTWRPVKDDALSASLPVLPQTVGRSR
jgi:branched-chain amino acid transport system substrate-binding protein